MSIQTNWCVITGAPSSGKTTIINALSIKGLQTVPEIARAYLVHLLDQRPEAFQSYRGTYLVQDKILELKLEREQKLQPDELIFFDRGVPDSLAYYRYYHLDTEFIMNKMMLYRYAYVFFLEELPIVHDGIRNENKKDAHYLGEQIYQAYEELGYNVIRIPQGSVEQRMTQILSSISTAELTANDLKAIA